MIDFFSPVVDFREWSPLEASDALELLSPAFRNVELRQYAVSRLAYAKSEQILLYLPQLVQGLKYERGALSAIGKCEVCTFIDSADAFHFTM